MGPRGRRLRGAGLLLAGALLGSPASAGPEEERPAEITKREIKDLVRFFADDDLEGRESGEPGCDRAAGRIAEEFARLGLSPFGGDGTFFQRFTIPRGTKLLPTSAMTATGADGKEAKLDLVDDFVPVSISGPGAVTAEAVFAGYGISASELGYDDYAGLDVKGKVVVVLRHAPAWGEKKSAFGDPAGLVAFATFQVKAETAVAAGAAALVIVNDPAASRDPDDDTLSDPGGTTVGKIPVVQVTWRAGRKLGSVLDVNFPLRQKQIDGKIQARSELLPGTKVHVRCDLEPDVRKVQNVAALLLPEGVPTTGLAAPAAPTETIVVGAHYDHVGRGRFGSLANANGKIHNGADDNASGTSSMLEIAGHLASRRADLRRRVLFLAFSGEELGLLGSKHYVGAPLVPLADTVAMLNLDMVGRMDKNRLYVGGTGTSPAWPDLLDRLNADTGKFQLTRWPGGKAPSDHDSFYGREVPVLFFFTGLHSDYHRPSDDWNTLEYDGMARVARFASDIAIDLATRPDRPAFTKCDAGGFEVGPYTGIGVEQRDDGVYVAHVDEKSPARKARFREGDRIVSWAGTPIPHTNAWNDVASKAKPGDKVEVVVSRAGKLTKLALVLGST